MARKKTEEVVFFEGHSLLGILSERVAKGYRNAGYATVI